MSSVTEPTVSPSEDEKIGAPSAPVDPTLSHTRQNLLIIVALQWILCIIPLLAGIYSVFFDDDPYNSQDVYSLIPLIATTILFTFGWIMAYILSRVGLLIFASIGAVLLVLATIGFGYITFTTISLAIGVGASVQIFASVLFYIVIFVIQAIVAVVTLKYSFKLAGLIKTYEYHEV